MNKTILAASAVLLLAGATSVHAAPTTVITNSTDPLAGGQSNGTVFTTAAPANGGTSGNTYPNPPNQGDEKPSNAFDGNSGTKYLNFGGANTGAIITPTTNVPAGDLSIATGIDFVSANDSSGRNPATYTLYGTNNPADAVTPANEAPGSTFNLADFTQISTGSTGLSNSTAPFTDSPVSFANSTAYQTYLLVFPTLSGDPFMQIGEANITGTFAAVPEPSTWMAAGGLLLLAAGDFRRRLRA